MEDAAFLLVGWTPDECEGKNLNGAIASDPSRVVTKAMIEEVGKSLGPPEGYYEIKLGGPFDALTRCRKYTFYIIFNIYDNNFHFL